MALSEIENKEANFTFKAISAYDSNYYDSHIKKQNFISEKNKALFFLKSFFLALKSDIIIIGHINQAPLAWMIKLIAPSKKIVLIAHGIEVWRNARFFDKKLYQTVYKILSVSTYTKTILTDKQSVDSEKIIIFHNTIEPIFKNPDVQFQKPNYLKLRYGIKDHHKILLSISRIDSNEKYKGYDTVIEALSLLNDKNIIYILAGKYDSQEYERIHKLLAQKGLLDQVFMIGYINELELTDHYLLADCFVMPSMKEGFGIVFIEAAFCGLDVIAGNKDGSVDALMNGELGFLVNPTNEKEIVLAVKKIISTEKTLAQKQALQQKVIDNFGFERYKNNLSNFLLSL